MRNMPKNVSVVNDLRPPSHTIRFLKKLILVPESNFEKSIIEKLINESYNISECTRKSLVCQLNDSNMNANLNS